MEIKDKMPKIVDMDKPEEDKNKKAKMMDSVFEMMEVWLPYDKETLDSLTYGVYLIKDKDDEIIYIGHGEVINELWAHAPFYKGRPEDSFPDAESFKVCYRKTKEKARKHEVELLEGYKKEHHGQLPKYNKRI